MTQSLEYFQNHDECSPRFAHVWVVCMAFWLFRLAFVGLKGFDWFQKCALVAYGDHKSSNDIVSCMMSE